jgi:ribonuclease-3
VLALIISDLLLARFPQEAEGALARRLSALVRRETLAEVAAGIELGEHLIFAKSEQEAGASANPALLANACEAVIGALYLDGGLAAARDFVLPLWTPLLEAEQIPPQDAKTALQEWAQGRGLALPEYREVRREGPPHEPVCTVEVSVIGQPPARGEGRSKRLAEQAAAARLLAELDGGRP